MQPKKVVWDMHALLHCDTVGHVCLIHNHHGVVVRVLESKQGVLGLNPFTARKYTSNLGTVTVCQTYSLGRCNSGGGGGAKDFI